MEYLDFEVEVSAGDAGGYDVKVLRSSAGEATSTKRLPFTAGATAPPPPAEEGNPRRIGTDFRVLVGASNGVRDLTESLTGNSRGQNWR